MENGIVLNANNLIKDTIATNGSLNLMTKLYYSLELRNVQTVGMEYRKTKAASTSPAHARNIYVGIA